MQLLKKAADEKKDLIVELGRFKEEVSRILFDKLDDFKGAQEEIAAVFNKRKQLYRAFKVLTEQTFNGYFARAEKPAFEVDLIFSDKYAKLPDIIPVCDYMYTFTDTLEFKRDFLGTSSFGQDDSYALKVLICYDHYQKTHGITATEKIERIGPARCPFYSCCDV